MGGAVLLGISPACESSADRVDRIRSYPPLAGAVEEATEAIETESDSDAEKSRGALGDVGIVTAETEIGDHSTWRDVARSRSSVLDSLDADGPAASPTVDRRAERADPPRNLRRHTGTERQARAASMSTAPKASPKPKGAVAGGLGTDELMPSPSDAETQSTATVEEGIEAPTESSESDPKSEVDESALEGLEDL
jgi:hypothetical protein